MNRSLTPLLQEDLQRKMILLTGPRQVGKTYISRQLMSSYKYPVYLNFDDIHQSDIIRKTSWPLETNFLILDEIHKMSNWKNYLKGIYDTKKPSMSILVTGSARMETFRQSGESLAGRYLNFRLHPFSVSELKNSMPPHEALLQLNQLGGFPEPFLSGSDRQATRWRNQYFTDLVREDIMDFSRIHEINTMRLFVELLRERTGSPLSLSSIAGDLQVSPNTVKSYLNILESLYIVFTVRPYHKNIARSLLKEAKVYFFDSAFIKGNDGARLENTVACCLLKHCHYQQDIMGKSINLHYLRTKDKREVDFLMVSDGNPDTMVEVKLSDKNTSRHLKYFKERNSQIKAIQIVQNLRQNEFNKEDDIHTINAADYLANLSG
jgi:predicted AAA+ superfamily ATPase